MKLKIRVVFTLGGREWLAGDIGGKFWSTGYLWFWHISACSLNQYNLLKQRRKLGHVTTSPLSESLFFSLCFPFLSRLSETGAAWCGLCLPPQHHSSLPCNLVWEERDRPSCLPLEKEGNSILHFQGALDYMPSSHRDNISTAELTSQTDKHQIPYQDFPSPKRVW